MVISMVLAFFKRLVLMSDLRPYERVRVKEVIINDTKVENCRGTFIKEVTHHPKFKGKVLVRIGSIDIMFDAKDVERDTTTYE